VWKCRRVVSQRCQPSELRSCSRACWTNARSAARRRSRSASLSRVRSVSCPHCRCMFHNRQRAAGTRRVHQPDHARACAGTTAIPRRRDLQEKRDRECPVVPASTAPNLHGKEGVDGSSPSEGSTKAPHVGAFSFRSTCCSSNVQWVWSRLWSFHASARLRHVVCERFAGDRLGSHPRVGVLGGQGFDWLSSPRRAIVGRPTNRPGGA
jgi:hypothetical protein